MSANLMSLGGLAIAIGMLVDAAVVVVENVVTQHLAHDPSKGRLPLLHLVNRAVREVADTGDSRASLIIITVFLPLADPARAGRQAVRAGGADHHLCAGRPRCCCR